MADKKITEFTGYTPPIDTDVFPVVDVTLDITKKITWASFKAAMKAFILGENDVMASGISRQAFINGNFDVWQRGTSFTPIDGTSVFFADRWFEYVGRDGGTLPTLTRTKQTLTAGDIDKSFYYSRLAFNGAGTSLGSGSQHVIEQRVENGVSKLCGNGKTVTLSFWARSDVANKKMEVSGRQFYGTGGSPSTADAFTGATVITLTSSWTKYTVVFTTVTLVGKTFGTAGDENLEIDLRVMWGSAIRSPAETYVGAGYIDIAQLQLCAGSVALPFQPKSFVEELKDCERYYQKSFPYNTTPAQAVGSYLGAVGYGVTNAGAAVYHSVWVNFPTRMRAIPAITFYNPISANAKWYNRNDGADSADGSTIFNEVYENGVGLQNGQVATDDVGNVCEIHYAVSAEL